MVIGIFVFLAWLLGLIIFPVLSGIGMITIGRTPEEAEKAFTLTIYLYLATTTAFILTR